METEEILNALYLGKAEFFDLPSLPFDIWHCPHCHQQLYCRANQRGTIVKCLLCHKKLELSPYDGFGYDVPEIKEREKQDE